MVKVPCFDFFKNEIIWERKKKERKRQKSIRNIQNVCIFYFCMAEADNMCACRVKASIFFWGELYLGNKHVPECFFFFPKVALCTLTQSLNIFVQLAQDHTAVHHWLQKSH